MRSSPDMRQTGVGTDTRVHAAGSRYSMAAVLSLARSMICS